MKRFVIFLGMLWWAANGVAAAQPLPAALRLQTAADALSQDAAEYAQPFAVPQAEAERRLRALAESVAATDRIGDVYRDRLAGISIEHRPTLRIIVYLTGDAAVPGQDLPVGGMTRADRVPHRREGDARPRDLGDDLAPGGDPRRACPARPLWGSTRAPANWS